MAPERLARWLDGFAERHGEVTVDAGADLVTVTAADGSTAEIDVPHPPLMGDDLAALVAHATAVRRIGVLLARRGGHAAGIFDGPDLVVSKVGRRHVQGRSAAGGWSQQRFARRREGQASVATQAAADDAARVLLQGPLDALVLGGDRATVEAVLDDPRLAPLRPLVTGRLLDVPDPRLTVLKSARFRHVRVRVSEPAEG